MTVESTWCYHVKGVCKNFYPDDQAFCAWNVFSSEEAADISKFANPSGFAGTEWQSESCLGDGGYQASRDFPPSNSPDSSCNSEFEGGGGGGGSSATTVPTTSEGTGNTSEGTSGTTDPTGGAEEEEVYLCSQQSPWKCANLQPDNALVGYPLFPDPYDDINDSNRSLRDSCWISVNPDAPPYRSRCTKALSQNDAVTKCQDDCQAYKDALEETCAGDAGCDLVTPIDCNLDGSYVNSSGQSIVGDPDGEKPVKKSLVSGWECDGELLALSDGPFNQFEAYATLVTPQGATAGVSSLRGYLGYKLPGCASNASTCTITIDTLVGFTSSIAGRYSERSGAGGVFEVQQMGFQSTAPFTGTWNRTRGTVTFPAALVNAQFWSRGVLIDSTPVTSEYGAYSIETDQIVGTLADGGPLSLNLFLDLPFSGAVSVSLRTVSPI